MLRAGQKEFVWKTNINVYPFCNVSHRSLFKGLWPVVCVFNQKFRYLSQSLAVMLVFSDVYFMFKRVFHLCVSMYMHMCVEACRDQEQVLDPVEL